MHEDAIEPCPYCSGCPLYAQFKSQNFLNTFKALYCEADFGVCERYKLRVAGAPVPPTLMPNGTDISELQAPHSRDKPPPSQ